MLQERHDDPLFNDFCNVIEMHFFNAADTMECSTNTFIPMLDYLLHHIGCIFFSSPLVFLSVNKSYISFTLEHQKID